MKIKKKSLFTICLIFVSLIVTFLAVFVPFKRNVVKADTINTYFYSPTFTVVTGSRSNDTQFYSMAFMFGLAPIVLSNSDGYSISFNNYYGFQGGSLVTNYHMFNYSTTGEITAPISGTYSWSNSNVPGQQICSIANVRFSTSSTAYNGIHLKIYALRSSIIDTDENGNVVPLYSYFDSGLVYNVSTTHLVFNGSISGQTRNVTYIYSDRHNVRLCFEFELSDATYFYNYYTNFIDLNLYFSGNQLVTSEEQLQDSYNNGYVIGYSKGENDGYENGYNTGSSLGYDSGYTAGDSAGYARGVASANNYSFIGLIGATIDAPIKALTGLLNFEILGVNLSAFVYGLFTITLVIVIIKYIKGGK